MPATEPPITCDLSVLTERQRARLEELTVRRFGEVAELLALPDGYRLGFVDPTDELLADLAEFLAFDRRCCPFLRPRDRQRAGRHPDLAGADRRPRCCRGDRRRPPPSRA